MQQSKSNAQNAPRARKSLPGRSIERASAATGVLVDSGPSGLLRAALGFTDVTVNIPINATLVEVEATLQLAVNGYKRLSEASERLKPIIGRILLTVQERNLFKPTYRNFTQFLMDRVVVGMGLGRSNAFDALKIARAFPSMSQEEYMRHGASRLLLAARVTDESQEGYQDFLKESTSLTVEELKNKIKETQGTQSASSYTISIRISPELKAQWLELQESTQLGASELFEQMLTAYKGKKGGQSRAAGVGHSTATH